MIKHQAIRNIHSNAVTINGDTVWDKDGNEIIIDDTLVQNETDRLQTEYDNKDYARKREAEYPSVQDLVVALYDTDDKTAIEAKRAEVKAKYPKS